MTTPQLVATLLVAGSAAAAGLVMLHARAAVATAVALVAGGAVAAAGAWFESRGAPGAARAAFLLAGVVLAPLALWAYPRAPRDAVERAALVPVVGPGLLCVTGGGRWVGPATAGFVTVLALIALTWWRLERRPDVRRPQLWAAFGVTTCGLLGLLLAFLNDSGPGLDAAVAAGTALQALVPVALAVGAVRPDTLDVRGLVVRAGVGAIVVTGYFAVFVGVASTAELAGAPLSMQAYAALGLLVALGVRPASSVLGGVVDRLLFGDRPDPLAAATRVAGRLGDDPAVALEAVREALAVPWVALRDAVGGTVAAAGAPDGDEHAVPLPPVGAAGAAPDPGFVLVVGLRPGDLRMPAADRRVLDLVAPLLAQILRARALAAEVSASRGHVVAAVEDERRRLRRDLHDGLGPTLTGVAFTVDAARNTVRSDPDGAAALLDAVRADTAEAIGQIRRIVYGMRPPALDELGLLGAVRQRAQDLRGADGGRVEVDVVADGDLADLPAAVEVAAYRIAVEALTNAARHSGARRVTVRVGAAGGGLVVEVTDDGTAGTPWAGGVGLASMRERAAEVNGALECGPTPSGGRVLATLPG